MGPVITGESKTRIEGLIEKGIDEGADVLMDGRHPLTFRVLRKEISCVRRFCRTLIRRARLRQPKSSVPCLGIIHADTVDDAIKLINTGKYGNMACLFTSSGAAARKFRYGAQIGNIGINVGVAAPMAFFPFSGWKESFFGDLHGQAGDAVDFFTQKKVVVERWF